MIVVRQEIYVPTHSFPLSYSDYSGLLCILTFAASAHSSCIVIATPFQAFHHSLRTVTIVFCSGAFAWHNLTHVHLLTSQSCLLPCVVWVKRQDSVCHSTRRQPRLQDPARQIFSQFLSVDITLHDLMVVAAAALPSESDIRRMQLHQQSIVS